MEKVNEYIDHYNKMNSLGLINNSIKESLDEINSYMNIADIKISINASKDSSELASHPNVISDTKIMMKHIDTLAKHGKMLSGDPDFGQEIIDSVKSTLEGAKSSQLQQLSQPSKSNAEVNMPLETKTNGIETTPVDIKEHFTKKVEKLIAQEPRILNDRKQDPVGYQDFLKIMLTLRDEIKASSLKPENKEIKSDLEAQAKRIDKSILRQANLSQKVSIKTQRLGEKKSEKIQEKIASKNEESHNEGTQPPRMRK